MPAHAKAPPRRATRTAPEEMDGTNHQQRVLRAHHSRRTVIPSVTASALSRQAASHSGQQFARLCAAILDGTAMLAANTFADARQVALHLHDDCHDDARLALGVASALTEIATQAHRAAELAAVAAARAAGEEGALWP